MKKYNKQGYDKEGYNREGYDKQGYDKEGYNRIGYDKQGYDRKGYDRKGFNWNRIHKITGSKYDEEGYDWQDYDRQGYNRRGYNSLGYDREGYDKEGYNRQGYDREGYNRAGYDIKGFNRKGIHKITEKQYDIKGYDSLGYNRQGFNEEGIHKITGSKYDETGYDEAGYDREGYNRDGYDREGYNIKGFNRHGYHRSTERRMDEQGYNEKGFNYKRIHRDTGTKYDLEGFDIYGYDAELFDREGFNRAGIDRNGFDRNGFNDKGIHKETGTKYNLKGLNAKGFNKDGIYGATGEEYDLDGYNQSGYDRDGFDINGLNKQGIRKDTGKKDERIQFAEEFIAFEKTIEQFAEEKGISTKSATSIIEKIRTFETIKEKIDAALSRNANRFLTTVKIKKKQLLTGKITIKDIKGIDTILRFCDTEERNKIEEMLIRSIASHDITIMEYGMILGVKHIDSRLPQTIIERLKQVNSIAKKSNNSEVLTLAKEVYKEIDRVKGYSAPYIPNPRERLGYMEKPTDKQPKMVDITNEHRDMAKQYLRATDEFICNKTMTATLMKIIKGELDSKRIERAKKEKELRTLQKEDEKLDEIIEMAEQVMSVKQNQTDFSTSVNLNDDNDENSL